MSESIIKRRIDFDDSNNDYTNGGVIRFSDFNNDASKFITSFTLNLNGSQKGD